MIAPVILVVAAMFTGHPGTQVSTDMSMCKGDYGCADISGHVIHMQGDLVEYLNWVARGKPADPRLTALAVFVFCHEARHVRGTTNEWVADQWAKSHSVTALRLLGASKPWAVSLRPLVWLWDRRLET